MELSELKKKLIKLAFTWRVTSSRRPCTADLVVRLDTQNVNDFHVMKNQSHVKITLIARGVYRFIDKKHFAWLVEGHYFYATFEYSLVGILIKYYDKRLNSLSDVFRGLLGKLDQLWVNEMFTTDMTFAEVTQTAQQLALYYNRDTYDFNKHDCRHFVWSFGALLDPKFSYFFKNTSSIEKSSSRQNIPYSSIINLNQFF